jgi:hypothetical protein
MNNGRMTKNIAPKPHFTSKRSHTRRASVQHRIHALTMAMTRMTVHRQQQLQAALHRLHYRNLSAVRIILTQKMTHLLN